MGVPTANQAGGAAAPHLALISRTFSVFFSHNKSINSSFSHGLSAKRTEH